MFKFLCPNILRRSLKTKNFATVGTLCNFEKTLPERLPGSVNAPC